MAKSKQKKKQIWIDLLTGNSFIPSDDQTAMFRCEKDGSPKVLFRENITGVSSMSRTFDFE